jgi:hypothetical protein
MIYNDKFVWVHFPKCAGTKVRSLFKRYFSTDSELFQDTIDLKNNPAASWHDSVGCRSTHNPAFMLGGRIVICSIRRLPSWLASRYNFEYQRSPGLAHNPNLLLEGKFMERGGYICHADDYIEKYLPQTLLDTGNVRFLRAEYFETDFIELFGKYLDLSVIPREEFIKRINFSKNHVPADILHSLRSSRDIYSKCPKWRAVEELAYASS